MSTRQEQFELERFEWKAPDTLEVVGKFHGLLDAKFDNPVLVVGGGEDAHRLRAASKAVAGPPEDGQSWRAQFVWTETPVGVEAASLELGPDIVVELPAPGAKKPLLRPRFLDVRRPRTMADAGPQPPAAATDVTLQAELLVADQQIHEVRAALERVESELDRARADVEAERSGRAADAERFREGLAQVRESAEQAVMDARASVQELTAQLTNARGTLQDADAALADLRQQLAAAEAARAEAESEREALREQVAAGDELRRRITAFEQAGVETVEMRADAERLLERLTKLVDALDAGE